MLADARNDHENGIVHNRFIVMDDCLRKEHFNFDEIATLLMNSRHYHIGYILTMQTPLGITPEFRCNFDYVILCKEESTINMKKLYDQYASMFPSLRQFKEVFIQHTQNYSTMFVDQRLNSRIINEKVFWYRASEQTFNE